MNSIKETRHNQLIIFELNLLNLIILGSTSLIGSLFYIIVILIGLMAASLFLIIIPVGIVNRINSHWTNLVMGPLFEIVFVILFSILLYLGIKYLKKHHTRQLTQDYQKLIDHYQILDDNTIQKHQVLFDLIDEICIGLNLKQPQLHVIQSKSANILAMTIHRKTQLCMTTTLCNQLSRAQLEAVIGIELLSNQTKYKQLQIAYQNLNNTIIGILSIASAIVGVIWMINVESLHVAKLNPFIYLSLVILSIIGIMYFSINWQINQRIQSHLSYLNTQSLHLTQNDTAMIEAFQIITQNKNTLPQLNSIIDNLWLQPITPNALHWSLQKQLQVLKPF